MLDIRLERKSANDVNATVTEIHAENGASVVEGEIVLAIETSKATEEIAAPCAGRVVHDLKLDSDVPIGSVLFRIDPERAEGAPAVDPVPVIEMVTAVADEPVTPRHRRVSPLARRVADQNGINVDEIDADLVSVSDVRRLIAKRDSAKPPTTSAPIIEETSFDAEKLVALPRHKQFETTALRGGAGNNSLSVIGVRIGKVAKRIGLSNPFFANTILDLVLFETSRLMRKYPKLNAAYAKSTHYFPHERVIGGVAFDDGARLIVYGVEDSDRLSLPKLQEAILSGIDGYMEKTLTAQQMSGATFTVTDLSSYDVGFVAPLLPQGQTLIVVVARDDDGYNCYAGFDHRVSEGREVALFLNDLKKRLRAYLDANTEHECHVCGKSMKSEIDNGGVGLLNIRNNAGQDVLSCRNCFLGL